MKVSTNAPPMAGVDIIAISIFEANSKIERALDAPFEYIRCSHAQAVVAGRRGLGKFPSISCGQIVGH